MSPSSTENEEKKKSSNPISLLIEIWNEEGLDALFVGFTPRILRAIVSGATQFATYEFTQNFLRNQL